MGGCPPVHPRRARLIAPCVAPDRRSGRATTPPDRRRWSAALRRRDAPVVIADDDPPYRRRRCDDGSSPADGPSWRLTHPSVPTPARAARRPPTVRPYWPVAQAPSLARPPARPGPRRLLRGDPRREPGARARCDVHLDRGGPPSPPLLRRSSSWLTLWRSSDGEDWERTLARPEGRPASIVSSGSTVIVAGNDLDPRYPDVEPRPELSWLMVSEDSGRTWDATLAWVGDADWCLRSLVANGATVSLDAACATPDAASIYLHRTTVHR